MEVTKVINVEGKTLEKIKQLQISQIIEAVEPLTFIYDEQHKDYRKNGKRTLFWFKTTRSLNEAFPSNKINRKKFHISIVMNSVFKRIF